MLMQRLVEGVVGHHSVSAGVAHRATTRAAGQHKNPQEATFFPMVRSLVVALSLALAAPLAAQSPASPRTAARIEFSSLIARFSEAGAYFDTDNLISNEASYLHPIGTLEQLGLRGGAYIGVGPDQNFSYIAALRPQIAFIADIRRDNLLHHLLLRALFLRAPTRIEYLALIHGRAPPPDLPAWRARGVDELIAWIDGRPADRALAAATGDSLAATIRSFGVPLSSADFATVARFREEFVQEGLDLRFQTHGRAPQWYYPTFRQLLRERDLDGRQASFLASEERYAFVRGLQLRGRIIPVVADLGGTHALRAIGDWLRRRRLPVTAFYTSNVEFYLAQDGTLDEFAQTLRHLPAADGAVIIRSYFPGRSGRHPRAIAGYHSTQLVQPIADFRRATRGALPGYWDLVTREPAVPAGRRVR
jgi:hypothetical protein